MKYLIDVCAFLGVVLIAAGVFVEFGTGYSLITAGLGLFVLSLIAAKVNNVFDEITE